MKERKEIPPHELPIQRAAATAKAICDYEFDWLCQDSHCRSLIGNTVPLLSGDYRPQGSVGVFHDITERKRTESALKERPVSGPELRKIPGVILIREQSVAPGPSVGIYAFARSTEQSNLYRIRLK